ncbi:MAG: large conductance mechanosensitive channel protein MscL [Clostridia bacterium]|nr:large conductance mechanosensitive channel protein MscL [Clostridia bacterium]
MEKKTGKIKGFFGEFKKFITRGNVLDMAVGVIVGGAFTGIVNGLSNFVLKPIINWLIALILGAEGLSDIVTFLPNGRVYKDVLNDAGAVIGKEIDMAASFYIDWGSFISAIINFLIIAFVLFMIVRTMNKIAAAKERLADGIDLDEKKEVRKIRREERVSKRVAMRIYQARVEEMKAQKAEADRIAAEKAAEEAAAAAAAAEEKAMANTRLLEEIRDLLKNK